ncbi:MAG TPA: hypothetical protein VI997_12000 [Candidatus Thermoplasmatota archaeon]|nr:hypothetical protein [Candidatus Thermoplasmatota archaeon]
MRRRAGEEGIVRAKAARRLISNPLFNGALNLTRDYVYGALNATGDKDLYRYKQPAACGSWFEIAASSLDGADIDIRVTDGDPTTIGTTLSKYKYNHTSTSSSETHRQENVPTNSVWSVLVEDKSSNIPYRIRYSCNQGGTGYTPPNIDDGDECFLPSDSYYAFACPTGGVSE